MPVLNMPCVSVRCDKYGYGFDECYATPATYMTILKENGWTGTYRKCYCLDCNKLNEIQKEKKYGSC